MQKTNFKTRLLALLTAVFMVIMCVPFAAFADGGVNVKFKGDTNSDDWNKVYAEKTFAVATDEIEAPKLPEGYDYWKSNNGTKDLKAGDKLTYADVKDAANGTVNYTPVKDQTPKTQTIYVSYIEEGNPGNVVGREEFQLDKSATYFNASVLQKVPEGWELARTGDISLGGSDCVNVEVRKVPTTKTIKINYYSEAEEKQIAEVEMTVPADATYVNTSKLTAPAGYELVLAGDLPIRDGYVYAAVRKVPTTTIKISYVDEATDKEVGTEDLVVNQGTTVVNFNVLKSVPAGYELCEVGDFYVGNGSAKVMVRKTKSNNGSSSSTSSSSSNKTTTASSKAEQKVVKAAAAPANTTKVLPKTGASNVAPLLGGSLAVVALLMGYGVYSLVLRKKD